MHFAKSLVTIVTVVVLTILESTSVHALTAMLLVNLAARVFPLTDLVLNPCIASRSPSYHQAMLQSLTGVPNFFFPGLPTLGPLSRALVPCSQLADGKVCMKPVTSAPKV